MSCFGFGCLEIVAFPAMNGAPVVPTLFSEPNKPHLALHNQFSSVLQPPPMAPPTTPLLDATTGKPGGVHVRPNCAAALPTMNGGHVVPKHIMTTTPDTSLDVSADPHRARTACAKPSFYSLAPNAPSVWSNQGKAHAINTWLSGAQLALPRATKP